ncbi:MAG: hypothetical protein IJC07_00370 [Clostridia bacterium]|nr:hypothetical protein [Clostridia bacterium]
MNDKDLSFFQSIAEKILVYCAQATINNSEKILHAEEFRQQFRLVENKKAPSEESASVDLQFNIVQNREWWTAKELKELPYLRDLKYRKTADGLHQFRYRRNGYNETFTSKKFVVAKKKAYDFIRELNKILKEQGESARGVRTISELKTVDFVARCWLENKKAHSSAVNHRVYMSVYKNHIEPAFGSRLVKTILPMDLQPFFNELFIKSGRTCENAKVILNGVFKYAVANRLCPSNPMDGVIVQKHVRTPGKALNKEERARFIQQMENEPNAFGLACLIALYSGCRGAELETLTFNWSEGTFSIRNAKLKQSQKVNPANLFRTLPIFPQLYSLKDKIESSETWRIRPSAFSDRFGDFWKGNSAKDLRHTFSTCARECGIENELVNVWMGHAPGKNLTANTYTHFSMEFQKDQAKKLRFD